MTKEDFENKTYIHRGYRYWKDSGNAVHRTRAKKEIWIKDRKKYPFEFREYQVHHKDGNKLNNRVENLELKTVYEHEYEHHIERAEWKIIRYLAVLLLTFSVIINSIFIGKRFGLSSNIRGWIVVGILFLGLILIIFLNRKKKGYKYI
jgi:hypothetical protein